MAKTCSACGRKAVDDQSKFCNKCGCPFPEERLKKNVIVRTEARSGAVPQAPPDTEPRTIRAPIKRPELARTTAPSPLPFKRRLGQKYIRPLYWLGVILIVLVAFTGITADLAKKGTAPDTAEGTDAKAPSADILSGIPVFWIVMLLLGNLAWRLVCELAAVQFAIYDSLASAGQAAHAGRERSPFDETMVFDDDSTGDAVECPHCGRVVPAGELRTCDHCGVQGCSGCIRLSGMIKKKLTCRECFEGR